MKVSARRRKGYAHSLTAGHHTLIADEPEDVGGSDSGPDPPELLGLSLAACTAITLEMYAERKQWDLGAVEVDVDFDLGDKDSARFDVLIKIPGDVTDEQLERLKSVAARCPVHRVLLGDVEINDQVQRG